MKRVEGLSRQNEWRGRVGKTSGKSWQDVGGAE